MHFVHFSQAVLASIIVVALLGMFRQFKDVLKYYRTCLPDMVCTVCVASILRLSHIDMYVCILCMYIIYRIALNSGPGAYFRQN